MKIEQIKAKENITIFDLIPGQVVKHQGQLYIYANNSDGDFNFSGGKYINKGKPQPYSHILVRLSDGLMVSFSNDCSGEKDLTLVEGIFKEIV